MSTPKIPQTLLLGLALMVTGCAEMPKDFAYANVGITPRVWPAPPETARYRYVGELTGEQNFIDKKEESFLHSVQNALKWMAGVFSDKRIPVVLQRPQSGMVDAEGRVYVTDISRQAVFVFDRPGGYLRIWDSARNNTSFQAPIGIVQGAKGEILVTDADLHSVIRLNQKGDPMGEFGKDVLKRPTGLARNAERGQIFVADTHAHDIKVFGDDGVLQNVIGRRGEGDAEFNFPTHLVFADGRLYVTDTMNSRIQVLDADGKMIAKFGERGLYVGNLVRPKGLAVDSERNIYVIESQFDNLLIFDGTGRTLMALGGTGTATGQFYLPSGVWVDNHDQVYVADMYNGRIQVMQFLGGQNETPK